jgi:hypothetical protein
LQNWLGMCSGSQTIDMNPTNIADDSTEGMKRQTSFLMKGSTNNLSGS